jgi:hypothetical protein
MAEEAGSRLRSTRHGLALMPIPVMAKPEDQGQGLMGKQLIF